MKGDRMDETDRKILEELERDGSKPLREIAEMLGMPLTTIHYRKTRMEEKGIIRGYRAIIDRKACGYPFMLLVFGRGGDDIAPGGRIEMVMKIRSQKWDVAVLARARDEKDAAEILEQLRRQGIKELSPIYVEEVVE